MDYEIHDGMNLELYYQWKITMNEEVFIDIMWTKMTEGCDFVHKKMLANILWINVF